jgi:hypothetical protein
VNALTSFCSYIEGTLGGCAGLVGFSFLLALPLIVMGAMSAWAAGRAASKKGRSAPKTSRRSGPSDFKRLQRLSAVGIDLSSPRDVEFQLFFRTEPSAKHAAAVLGADYGTLVEKGVSEHLPSQVEQGYLLHARVRMVLNITELSKRQQRLAQLAEGENGLYLGWSTDTKLVSAHEAGA